MRVISVYVTVGLLAVGGVACLVVTSLREQQPLDPLSPPSRQDVAWIIAGGSYISRSDDARAVEAFSDLLERPLRGLTYDPSLPVALAEPYLPYAVGLKDGKVLVGSHGRLTRSTGFASWLQEVRRRHSSTPVLQGMRLKADSWSVAESYDAASRKWRAPTQAERDLGEATFKRLLPLLPRISLARSLDGATDDPTEPRAGSFRVRLKAAVRIAVCDMPDEQLDHGFLTLAGYDDQPSAAHSKEHAFDCDLIACQTEAPWVPAASADPIAVYYYDRGSDVWWSVGSPTAIQREAAEIR